MSNAPLSRASSAPWDSVVADKLGVSPQAFTIEPSDDLQAVFDSINSGRSVFTPYAIGLMPGVYQRDPGNFFRLRRSNVYLYSVIPHAAIIYNNDQTVPGSLTVSDTDTSEVTDVTIDGITFVKSLFIAPAPALAIGNPNGTGMDTNNPKGGLWNRITIVNCDIIGNHDGVQFYGNQSNFGRVLFFQNNRVFCCHDAVAIKCHGIIRSNGNIIHVDDTPHPFLASAGLGQWKMTGFHCSGTLIGDGTEAFDPTQDYLESVGDSVYIIAKSNVGGGLGQNVVAGYLCYGPSTDRGIPTIHIVDPSIVIQYDTAHIANMIAGVGLFNSCIAADGDYTVRGGRIRIKQLNAGGNIANVAGIESLPGAVSSDSIIRAIGTSIHVTNAAAGGTAASLQTAATTAHAKIIASVYSEQATIPGTVGSIVAATIKNA